ncbi:MAG TPA: tetratricopeptide repeat protein, partial [Rhizomicrobium sp.]
MSSAIEQMLDRARHLAATRQGEQAQAAYLEILHHDPAHFAALNELAIIAYESGHRSAARTLYEQAVRSHPQNAFARVNLGNLLYEAGESDTARAQFEAGLALDGKLAEAHQGLARILADRGESQAAEDHWRKSFRGQAIVTRRYRGAPPGIALLLLVSAKGGNIPMLPLLDERIFAITALYVEYYNPALPLPPHSLMFNAIGDADLCADALDIAAGIATHAKVINPPEAVRRTGRAENAIRLADVPGVIA